MTTYTIPIQAVPNQVVTTTIGTDFYSITLNTRLGRLYISIVKNGKAQIYNRICRDATPILKQWAFIDIDGNTPPTYDKLNSRYFLVFNDGV